MSNVKAGVVAAVELARANLDQALRELERIPERLPASDPARLGYVAHALTNYLSVTEVTTELLQIALKEHQDPEVATWLTGIHHMVEMMHHTVGTLLHASSPADFPLKPDAVNLTALMERACRYYERLATRKRIAIACGSVGNVRPAWADRVAVAVVADNLLSNAVKFSPEGRQVHVQIMSAPGSVVCSVRDQGPGLSPEDQGRLFQEGVPLSAVPTGGEPSTGFGLAIAREFVERMGGALWCESEYGNGACFSFRLPVLP
jgi:signal transduction histidine kinase